MTPKSFIGALVGALGFYCLVQPANAITLNSGDAVVYNFDFTGQTPAPPYSLLQVCVFFSGVTPVASTIQIDTLAGLNATGGTFFTLGPLFVPTGSTITFGDNDGIFSVRFTAVAGLPFDIDSVLAEARNSIGQLTTLQGELVTPLPAALPLFAGGLGALGLLGWRRKKQAAALVA